MGVVDRGRGSLFCAGPLAPGLLDRRGGSTDQKPALFRGKHQLNHVAMPLPCRPTAPTPTYTPKPMLLRRSHRSAAADVVFPLFTWGCLEAAAVVTRSLDGHSVYMLHCGFPVNNEIGMDTDKIEKLYRKARPLTQFPCTRSVHTQVAPWLLQTTSQLPAGSV